MHLKSKTAFLTPEEMAVKLRISIRKLQAMIKDGTAPPHVRLGTRLLFILEGSSHE